MKKKILYSVLLFCGTFIWGSSFVAQSAGTDFIGPYTFSAVRCPIGALFVLLILLIRCAVSKKRVFPILKKALIPGLLCGAAHAAAVITQQVGIFYTGNNTARAGFLTALYIVIVPVLGLFLHRKVKANMWVGVALGVVGMYIMCIGGGDGAFGIGDILLVVCSLFYSLQILLLDRFAPEQDPFALSFIQYSVTSVVSIAFMFAFEKPTVSGILNSYIPLLYCGVLSMGIASTIQVISQRELHPAVASLIMSLESVIALFTGWVYFGNMLKESEWIGCIAVFAGVLCSQADLIFARKKALPGINEKPSQ